MGNFVLNNGQNIDLSLLKAGLHINKDNEILQKYDTNKNSIFDVDELAQFKADIEAADTNNDNKISKEEGMSLASLLGIAENKISSLFNDKNNAIDDTLSYLYQEQAKQNAINQFSSNFEQANKIFNAAKGGGVTQTYDNIKEFFNDEYTSSKVYRQLCNQLVTSAVLKEADEKGGITKQEYYKQKILLFSMMLDLSDVEKYELFDSIKKMPIEEFEATYQQLVNCEDGEYSQVVNKIKKQFGLGTLNTNNSEVNIGFDKKSIPGTIGEIFENKSVAESKLTFEQVYKNETGVGFDAQKINNYKKNEMKANFASELNNRIAPLQHDLAKKYEQAWFDRDNGFSETYNPDAGNNPQNNFTELRESTENALRQYYQNDTSKIIEFLYKTTGNEKFKELLEDYNKQKAEIEKTYANDKDTQKAYLESNAAKLLNTALQIMWSSNRDSVMNITQGLYKEMQAKKETLLENALDGKTIEDFSGELKQAYASAFGNNCVDLAQEFAQDQQKGVLYAKIAANTGVGLLSLVPGGGLASFAIGSIGMLATNTAISLTEGFTKEGGMQDGDWAELKEELKSAEIFMIPGVGAGMAAAKIGQKVLTCTKFMGKITSLIAAKGTEYASDFAMSMLVDLALTHRVDLTGETISELINIIIGAAAGAKAVKSGKLGVNGKELSPSANQEKNQIPKVESNDNHVNKTTTEQEVKTKPTDDLPKTKNTESTSSVSRLADFEKVLSEDKISYQKYNDKDGNQIIKIVSKTETKDAASGTKFWYDCYKYDKDGNLVDMLEGATDKEIKSKFGKLKNEKIVDNGNSSNTSGTVYSSFFPILKKYKTEAQKVIEPKQLERREVNVFSSTPKSLDDVMSRIKYVCQKYGYNTNDVVENYLKGLDINLKIFDTEQALLKYINECVGMAAVKLNGVPAYNRKFYNFRDNYVDYRFTNNDLIRDIALLRASDSKMDNILSRVCYFFESGNLDQFSFEKIVKYLKEGYVSPETIDVCLNTGLINNKHLDFSNVVDSEVTSNKNIINVRKKIIDTIDRVHPELKPVIRQLKNELGDDIYRIKWDCLDLSNLDKNGLRAFVQDAKNLIHMKNIELQPDNFYINIPGYKRNEEWGRKMVEISENASKMLSEGASSDDVLAYIAAETRQISLSGSIGRDPGKLRDYGLLRGERDGYFCDPRYSELGAITPYSNPPYNHYAEKFNQRVSKPLRNPYEGQIELTRLTDCEQYPIEPNEYNPNNPKHRRVIGADGQVKYYEEVPSMIHPKGKYASNALNIVKNLQDGLMSKYKGKALTEGDIENIHETIGEIHWVLAHSMPWGRGSDAIANSYVKSIYQSLGFKTYPPKEGISFDLEAFCTELEDYKKNYKNYYEKQPKIVK